MSPDDAAPPPRAPDPNALAVAAYCGSGCRRANAVGAATAEIHAGDAAPARAIAGEVRWPAAPAPRVTPDVLRARLTILLWEHLCPSASPAARAP